MNLSMTMDSTSKERIQMSKEEFGTEQMNIQALFDELKAELDFLPQDEEVRELFLKRLIYAMIKN